MGDPGCNPAYRRTFATETIGKKAVDPVVGISHGQNITSSTITSMKGIEGRAGLHPKEDALDLYRALWGQNFHHGYFQTSSDSKEQGQMQLVDFLLRKSKVRQSGTVLDIDSGTGDTCRYLARRRNCRVTGITNDRRQLARAKQRAAADDRVSPKGVQDTEYFQVGQGGGEVRFLELDAESMGNYFGFTAEPVTFDCIWAVEALSRVSDKELFFRNAEMLLDIGGKLVVTDFFKRSDAINGQVEDKVKSIEDGLKTLPLSTTAKYIKLAEQANLTVPSTPINMTESVSQSWVLGRKLLQDASALGSDFARRKDVFDLKKATQAISESYTTGNLRYMLIIFEKTNS